eukprot:7196743-Pyramimonas_sp.AAC.1
MEPKRQDKAAPEIGKRSRAPSASEDDVVEEEGFAEEGEEEQPVSDSESEDDHTGEATLDGEETVDEDGEETQKPHGEERDDDDT